MDNFMHWWLYCQLKTPVPIEQEGAWEQDLVWTLWTRGKFLPLSGFESQTVQYAS